MNPHIEPPPNNGIPERYRLMLARFRDGCEVCGVMDWYATRSDGDACVFSCGNCGNVFDVPVIEEPASPHASGPREER